MKKFDLINLKSEFISLIEAESKARGIAAATFCNRAAGNNRLLRTLKTDGNCTLDVAERVASYVQLNPIRKDKGAAE